MLGAHIHIAEIHYYAVLKWNSSGHSGILKKLREMWRMIEREMEQVGKTCYGLTDLKEGSLSVLHRESGGEMLLMWTDKKVF